MRWQYWAILFLFIGLNVSARAAEQEVRLDQQKEIKDLQTTTLYLDSFQITKIKSIQFEITIDHQYIGDLTVELVSPNKRKLALHSREGGSRKYLNISATTNDLLAELIDTSAVGTWTLIIKDHAKQDEGKLTSLHLRIEGDLATSDGDSEETIPEVEDPITPPVVTGSCEERWGAIISQRPMEPRYTGLINLCGERFKAALKGLISTNRDLGYTGARQVMFSSIDNVDGVVCSVYTPDCIETRGIPSSNRMNCEHTWPQSKGATGIAKSDLHHLYPVDSKRNSIRGNYPFCEVVSVTSGDEHSALGQSASGTKCFEPPQVHKGNVARSMFYFAVRYGHTIDQEQLRFFNQWNAEDPVDSLEQQRTEAIESVQGNRNPFVDHPEFASLL